MSEQNTSNIIISILHLAFVGFVVLVPFYGNSYLRLVHAIILPFIMGHWIANNNSCALTLMEKKVREHLHGGSVDNKDCIVANIIEPVYDFVANNKQHAVLIYIITFSLWAASVYKLYNTIKSGEIKSPIDLLRV